MPSRDTNTMTNNSRHGAPLSNPKDGCINAKIKPKKKKTTKTWLGVWDQDDLNENKKRLDPLIFHRPETETLNFSLNTSKEWVFRTQ